MSKKIALITLIEASLILSFEDKLTLIHRVPSFTEKQVDTLGKYFAYERKFALDHETEIREQMEALLTELNEPDQEHIYVGTGKPS